MVQILTSTYRQQLPKLCIGHVEAPLFQLWPMCHLVGVGGAQAIRRVDWFLGRKHEETEFWREMHVLTHFWKVQQKHPEWLGWFFCSPFQDSTLYTQQGLKTHPNKSSNIGSSLASVSEVLGILWSSLLWAARAISLLRVFSGIRYRGMRCVHIPQVSGSLQPFSFFRQESWL